MAGAAVKFVAPGKRARAQATSRQMEAVEALVRESVAAVDALAPGAVRHVLPVLRDAILEAREGLLESLKKADGGARFTAQDRRTTLRALEAAFQRAKRLEPAMGKALEVGRHTVGALSIGNLTNEVARFSSIFGEGLVVPNLDLAAILAEGDRMLIPRHRTSAARYAGSIRQDIGHQLAIGVARKETFDQLATRLQKLGGPRGPVALRGIAGEPGAVVENISEGLFRRYRGWAERLVRTELMHGYNVQHDLGIDELNADLDEDEEPYLRRWDASADKRVCPICAGLDSRAAPVGGLFLGRWQHPPAHPYCRCVLVAWHASWGNIVGEVPLAVDVPDAAPPKAAPPRAAPHRAEDDLATYPGEPAAPGERLPAAPASAAVDRQKVAAELARRQAEADEERRRFDEARRKALAAKSGAPAADPAREALPWEDAARRGDFEGMRAGIVADLQRQYGLVEQTWREHRFGFRVDPDLDTPGALDWSGVVLFDQPTADHLAKFGRASADDRAALFAAIRDPALRASSMRPDLDLMEVHAATALVHESVHGHGALTADIYAGKGATIEEIATETLARRYMVDRLGAPRGMFYPDLADAPDIPSIGAYNDVIDPLVNGVARDLKISRHAAAVMVEDASIAFKRLQVGDTPTVDSAVEHYLDGLPAKARNNARKALERMGAGEVVVVPAPVAKPEKVAKVAKPKPEKAAKPAPAPKPAKPAKPKAAPKKTAADRAAAAAEKKAQAAAARAAAAAEKKRLAAEARAAKAAAAKEAKARAAAEKKAALAAAREAAKAEKARIAAEKRAAAAKAKKPAKITKAKPAPKPKPAAKPKAAKAPAPAKAKPAKPAKAAKPKATERAAPPAGAAAYNGPLVQLPPPGPPEHTPAQRARYKEQAIKEIAESREKWAKDATFGYDELSDEAVAGLTYSEVEFAKRRRAFADSLPDDEVDACLWYSNMGDRVANSAFRYGTLDAEPDVKAMTDKLTAAIRRHKMPEDTYVSRGLEGKWAKDLGNLLQPGDVFREPAYCSTSATQPFDGELKMRIRIPKGAAAAPIPTRFTDESEFLLPPGTSFRIISNRKYQNDYGKDRWELEVEVIS